MTSDILLSLALFMLVSSITPGPNNVMLTASGATFGYRRTLPHILGVSLGAAIVVLLTGAGVGAALQAQPALHTGLKYLGAAYLLYLAWRIACAGPGDGSAGATRQRPFTFLEAAAFQWINPKVWMMAIGIVATYMPQQAFFQNLVLASAVLVVVNFPSVSVWALFGSAVGRLLGQGLAIRYFNVCMALLLVASLYPILAPA
ncbi:LysE family translocator [Paracandidimonas lactea]|uniref:LysE family translocator n=1 Tax=Paracandidimonas lactea TaxID=2895524 RepID=UPI001EEF7AD2|nr:LysE family translocator [Paracandidimonas lactea]